MELQDGLLRRSAPRDDGWLEGGLRRPVVSATMRPTTRTGFGSSLDMPILKKLLCAAAVFGLGISAASAQAQTFPNRPITLVIPFAPGGSTTIVGRGVADKMGELLGEKVVVDNRPGAGGTVGTKAVAKSEIRRLHAGARLYRHARDRAVAVQECRLRSAQGFCADRHDRQRAEFAGGQPV